MTNADINLLNKMVGPMSDDTAAAIMKKIDCFLHPKVSLFIPSSGQCEYAVTPSHSHPTYSFIYYFQPYSDYIVQGKAISLGLADGKCLSALSPDIPHQEVEQDHFQSYIAIMIDAGLFKEAAKQYTIELPVFLGEAYVPHPELLAVLRCFMLESGQNRKRHSELPDHLASVIAHLVARSVVCEAESALPLYDRFEVDSAIAYMNSHLTEKITMETLAEYVHRSASHFSKVFKSVTDMTPMDFLQMIRLQKARMLLIQSSKNITEIAMECGFSTSSYFSYCFLEKYTSTPSAFRQNFQQNGQIL